MKITDSNYHNTIKHDGMKVAKLLDHVNPNLETKEEFMHDFSENNNSNIDSLVQTLNKNVRSFQDSLEFHYNEDEGQFNFVLWDTVTGDVIREYPTKDISKLEKQVDEILGSILDESR
jgi:uncharacterized FlaG/YvyC family protein